MGAVTWRDSHLNDYLDVPQLLNDYLARNVAQMTEDKRLCQRQHAPYKLHTYARRQSGAARPCSALRGCKERSVRWLRTAVNSADRAESLGLQGRNIIASTPYICTIAVMCGVASRVARETKSSYLSPLIR